MGLRPSYRHNFGGCSVLFAAIGGHIPDRMFLLAIAAVSTYNHGV
jgi:hypothetical protein